MKLWSPLLLLALTACAPTVHVVEGPKNQTFADVDVCTLLKDGDVERQKLVGTIATGRRSCEFAFGKDAGAVSVEVTLLAESYDVAKRPLCEGFDSCAPNARFTKVNGRSAMHKCDDTAGSMQCEGLVQAGQGKTLKLVVKRSPDSAEALGQLTDGLAQVLLNLKPVTS